MKTAISNLRFSLGSCQLSQRSITRRRVEVSCTASCPQGTSIKGKCWLVGAGPGSKEYLTVRATTLLQQAEVVVYDDLGAQDALDLVPPGCALIYAGKRGGRPSIKQSAINDTLVEHCRQGRRVLRLKGGCLSVFSRVSSEVAALAAAGCEWELVPGVSSALAAPLLAGFPLTDASIGSSFAVVSAHDPDATDWAAFSRIPTLVILMGGRALAGIMLHLQQHGWSPDTPVAVVREAGTPRQQTWTGEAASIADITQGETLSPCIVVVGAVAQLPATWHALLAASVAGRGGGASSASEADVIGDKSPML